MAQGEIDYNIVFPDAVTSGEPLFIVMRVHACCELREHGDIIRPRSVEPCCQQVQPSLPRQPGSQWLWSLQAGRLTVCCVCRETLAEDKGASCDSARLGRVQGQTPLQVQLHLQ